MFGKDTALLGWKKILMKKSKGLQIISDRELWNSLHFMSNTAKYP